MRKHTVGKLKFDEYGHIVPENQKNSLDKFLTGGFISALNAQGERGEQVRANDRRIVAAWNACDEISTEALEQGVIADLLEAAKYALIPESHDRLEKLKAAIHKAEGK